MFQRIDIVDGKKWSLIRSQSQSGCDAQRRGRRRRRFEIVFERIKDTTIVSLLEFGIVAVVTTTSGMMSTI